MSSNKYDDLDIIRGPFPSPSCADLDAILGFKHNVLHDGFIRVVDYLGTDASVVQAARVSYGLGTKTWQEDEQLIRFMIRHGHATPFEQCEIKLHVRLPIDVMRQWVRHRTAHVNEYSTRYSEAIDSQHEVAPDEWRLQSSTNRQGSGETLTHWLQIDACDWPVDQNSELQHKTPGEYLTERQESAHNRAVEVYEEAIRLGVAREQARAVLPLSTYTEIYWKCDLRNLLGFLRLRLAPDAQKEIRDYANVIAEIVEQWVPMTWRAFEDYQLNAMTLSVAEVNWIRTLNSHEIEPDSPDFLNGGISKREVQELQAKLVRLGIVASSIRQTGGAS